MDSGKTSKFCRIMIMSKFFDRKVHLSKWICSTYYKKESVMYNITLLVIKIDHSDWEHDRAQQEKMAFQWGLLDNELLVESTPSLDWERHGSQGLDMVCQTRDESDDVLQLAPSSCRIPWTCVENMSPPKNEIQSGTFHWASFATVVHVALHRVRRGHTLTGEHCQVLLRHRQPKSWS